MPSSKGQSIHLVLCAMVVAVAAASPQHRVTVETCHPACSNRTCNAGSYTPASCVGSCTLGYHEIPMGGCAVSHSVSLVVSTALTASCAVLGSYSDVAANASGFADVIATPLGVASSEVVVTGVACSDDGKVAKIPVEVSVGPLAGYEVLTLESLAPLLAAQTAQAPLSTVTVTILGCKIVAIASICDELCATCVDVGAHQCVSCRSGFQLTNASPSGAGTCALPSPTTNSSAFSIKLLKHYLLIVGVAVGSACAGLALFCIVVARIKKWRKERAEHEPVLLYSEPRGPDRRPVQVPGKDVRVKFRVAQNLRPPLDADVNPMITSRRQDETLDLDATDDDFEDDATGDDTIEVEDTEVEQVAVTPPPVSVKRTPTPRRTPPRLSPQAPKIVVHSLRDVAPLVNGHSDGDTSVIREATPLPVTKVARAALTPTRRPTPSPANPQELVTMVPYSDGNPVPPARGLPSMAAAHPEFRVITAASYYPPPKHMTPRSHSQTSLSSQQQQQNHRRFSNASTVVQEAPQPFHVQRSPVAISRRLSKHPPSNGNHGLVAEYSSSDDDLGTVATEPRFASSTTFIKSPQSVLASPPLPTTDYDHEPQSLLASASLYPNILTFDAKWKRVDGKSPAAVPSPSQIPTPHQPSPALPTPLPPTPQPQQQYVSPPLPSPPIASFTSVNTDLVGPPLRQQYLPPPEAPPFSVRCPVVPRTPPRPSVQFTLPVATPSSVGSYVAVKPASRMPTFTPSHHQPVSPPHAEPRMMSIGGYALPSIRTTLPPPSAAYMPPPKLHSSSASVGGSPSSSKAALIMLSPSLTPGSRIVDVPAKPGGARASFVVQKSASRDEPTAKHTTFVVHQPVAPRSYEDISEEILEQMEREQVHTEAELIASMSAYAGALPRAIRRPHRSRSVSSLLKSDLLQPSAIATREHFLRRMSTEVNNLLAGSDTPSEASLGSSRHTLKARSRRARTFRSKNRRNSVTFEV